MQIKPKNDEFTETEVITKQMLERRPLPMGRSEFMEWSERIISGALVDCDRESQRFVLADLLTHLGPQESHKEDAFFIHTLRKMAVNQLAITMRAELKAEHDKKVEAQKALEAEKLKEEEQKPGHAPDELSRVVEACRLV